MEGLGRWVEAELGEGACQQSGHERGPVPLPPRHQGEKLPELSFWMLKDSGNFDTNASVWEVRQRAV